MISGGPGAAPPNTIVDGIDLAKIYRRGKTETAALRGVSLSVSKGEVVFILGPSGSGKSTLLQLLGALDTPTRGKVLLFGEDVASKSDRERSLLRRARLGFVFQSFHLVNALTAVENVLVPRVPAGVTAQDRERARSLLERLGLGPRLEHLPDELSGGESQRVAIARALIGRPELVLADEPTGELDGPTGAAVVEALREAARSEGAAIVIVTHDERLVKEGDRVLRLRDGLVAE
jgi:putative ABC transport system ATP-binding protein